MRKILLSYLLIIILALCCSITTYSQTIKGIAHPLPQEIANLGIMISKVDANGKIYCETPTLKEYENYSLNKNINPHFTLVRSLNNPQDVRGLKIILRASDQLIKNPEALIAFRRAAARWETYIRTNITVVIDVDYGDTRWGQPWGAGVIGSTNSSIIYITKQNGDTVKAADIVNSLLANHVSDQQLLALYNAIPIPTPSTAGSNLGIAIAGVINFQELGILNADMNPDPQVNPFGSVPSIGFNSSFNFDLDPSDGIDANAEDFDATVTHEIGHALGFVSVIGSGGDPYNFFTPWDLFRVRPDAVQPNSLVGFSSAPRVVTPGPPPSQIQVSENGVNYYKAAQVVFDGLTAYEVSTATGSRTGGDGQQASHWRDDAQRPPSLGNLRKIGIMDPTSSGTGIRDTIQTNDLRMLEVLGYTIDYNPIYASVLLIHNLDTLDLNKSTDTIKISDIALNDKKTTTINLVNLNLNNVLNYETEVITDVIFPANASVEVNIDVLSGSINSGHSGQITLSAGNSPVPAVVYGTLRFHTNDENRLVIDIPFKASSGGAIAPTLVTDKSDLGSFVFESNSEKLQGKGLTLTNKGNLDLSYRLLISLSDKSNQPTSPSLAKSGKSNSNQILSHFFKKNVVDSTEVLFSDDFENGLNNFDTSGTKSEDWHLMTRGPALLDGHSKPTVVHFGKDYIDSIRYRNYADAYLISKSFDLSSIPSQDLITLSFNYYLQAEVGYDFASVLVSIDDGKTFEEVATSDNGIMKNDSVWQSLIIQLPYLSGNISPVKFAFRFTSDQLVELEGWFFDDVQLDVIKNANSIYTDVKSGTMIGLNSANNINLFVNAQNMDIGFYNGSLSIVSNDPVRPNVSIPFTIKNINIQPAQKNIIYASTGRGTASNGRVLIIDKNTGAGSEVGISGFEPLKSLTISPVNDEIYGLNANAFIQSSVIRVNAKDAYGLFQFESKIKLSAIVFDKNNNLYAASDDKNLYKLDPETGDTTFVGNLGFKVGAMTMDDITGDIIASVDATSNKDNLYKINPVNAQSTLIGSTGLNKITRALAMDQKRNLYGTVGEENQISSFISIDPNTGLATQIGDVNYRGVFGLAVSRDTTTSLYTAKSEMPQVYKLYQNYPNPFNPTTKIKYSIAALTSFLSPRERMSVGQVRVILKVFDILGREVATLVNEEKPAGFYEVEFNGSNLANGIYFYQLKAENFVDTKKFVLLK